MVSSYVVEIVVSLSDTMLGYKAGTSKALDMHECIVTTSVVS